MGLASSSGIFPAVCSGAGRGFHCPSVAAETRTNLKHSHVARDMRGDFGEGLYLPPGLLFWENRWLHRPRALAVAHQGHFQGDTKITGTNTGAGDGDESDRQHTGLQ